MTTEDQLQLPHIETIGTDTIEFRRLDVDDLAQWANEVKAKRVADETARLKLDPTLNAEMRQRLVQRVALQEVEFADLDQRTYTPAGAKKALILSLKKGGKTDGDAVAALKRIHFSRQQKIAQIVMSPPEPAMVEGEQSGPPAEDGTGAIGS